MTKIDGKYRTSDIYYAAFLKTAGVPYLDYERVKDPQNPRRTRTKFIFERTEGIRELKSQYFARLAVKISPLTFADEVKALKYLTHEGEDEEE